MPERSQVVNFSAGPSMLPNEVMETLRDEMMSYRGSGMSVMELSHRGKHWMERLAEVEANLRKALEVPDDYAVLFSTGGASQQFAMVPTNLAPPGASADYVVTGQWARLATEEVAKVGRVARIAGTGVATDFDRLPRQLDLDPNAAYFHYTSNNTVRGTEYHFVPEVGDVPLVCDASSNILSRRMDIRRYAVVYAGAQKNLGPAGVTLVIVRKDLLDRATWPMPTLYSYKTLTAKGSMPNTPPVLPIHIVGYVVEWVLANGGADGMEERARKRSELLYGAIDELPMFVGNVVPEDRSRMNVTFHIEDAAVQERFIKEATAANFSSIKGYRDVGGMRVSMYNAMPVESVERFVAFMRDFAARVG